MKFLNYIYIYNQIENKNNNLMLNLGEWIKEYNYVTKIYHFYQEAYRENDLICKIICFINDLI